MDDVAPTIVKSLDEVRTSLAKSYVANSGDLVVLYSREELDFIINNLTRALEGSSFPGQTRIVNETRTLLQRWDWTSVPNELEGNLKVYVFRRLRLERSKTFTFKRLESLILSRGEENVLNLGDYVGSKDSSEPSEEELVESSDTFTYYVIDYSDISKFDLATVLISMGNQSEHILQLRPHDEFIVISDDPDLDEATEDSLAVYIEGLVKEEGVINKKYLDENVESGGNIDP